jgi:predicted transcriptional regulator
MAKGVKAASNKAAKVREAKVPEATVVPVETDEENEKEIAEMMKPGACRSHLRRRLAKEFPKIVDGFVEEAKKGGCNHLKQTVEMLKPVKGTPRRKGSAAKMLEEMDRWK